MLKINKRNIRTRCEICSSVFIVNFEHISHLFFSVSIVNFEQVNPSWKETVVDVILMSLSSISSIVVLSPLNVIIADIKDKTCL